MAYQTEPIFAHGTPAKTGILLINLGTPDAPTAKAVRPYLKEFLGDPRVVEIPRAIWWLILNGIILNTRPKKSAAKYATIWMPEGSPLRVHTEKQTSLLQGYLSQRTKAPYVVDYAMRYGNPSIASVLRKLREQNCQRILVVPMYPQYAASAAGTAFDIVFAEVQKMRNTPALRTIRNFHDNPGYIKSLANNINDYWMKNGRPEKLVMSFHGLPQFTLDKGDPYHCECHKTGRLLGQELGLKPEQYFISFQSRFGKAQALYHRDAQGSRQAKDQARGRGLSRFRRRLPRDAGRDRDGRQGRFSARGRRRIPLHPLPRRTQRLDARADRSGDGKSAWLADRAG